MKTKNSHASIKPRSALDRFRLYQAGMSIDQVERQYGIKKIIKLASNENPSGPSPKAVSAYKKAADSLFRYPESFCVNMRNMVAQEHKLDIANVIFGAGSDEIIELLAKAFLNPQDEVVVSESSFLQYKNAGNLMDARVVEVPMKNLTHDLKGMTEAVTEKTKLLFIANPNNPTGTYNTKAEVESFLNLLPDHVLPVIDEAYFEYAREVDDYPDMLSEFFRKRPMMVLRTFSKVFGLAGLRIGYGVGPDWCVEALDKIRPPFNVSYPAQQAAQAAFLDAGYVEASVKMNRTEKANLSKSLTEMGFAVVPSAANFILFKVAPKTGQYFFNQLIQKGIIARSVDEYGLSEYLRITVGTPAENKKFLNALGEVLAPK